MVVSCDFDRTVKMVVPFGCAACICVEAMAMVNGSEWDRMIDRFSLDFFSFNFEQLVRPGSVAS